MANNVKEKIEKLGNELRENFDLKQARQIDALFPEFHLKKLIELETLLTDLYGVTGKSQAIGLAASYLISEIVDSKEFEDKAKADKIEKDAKTA